jgi:hypothetical protein
MKICQKSFLIHIIESAVISNFKFHYMSKDLNIEQKKMKKDWLGQ